MALIITDQSGNQYALSVNSTDGSLITTPVTGVTPSTNDDSVFITALDMITRALRLIGVVASGELPTSDEANDSLASFRDMVDSWNADSLSIYTTRADDYPLTASQQSFTLGPGGDYDTNRPARIIGMSAILLNNPANPIEVPMEMYTILEWQTKIPVKDVTGTFPLVCYDDGGMPLRTLNFWPIPTPPQNNVRIYTWQSLIWPATLQTILNFPPGYARAFRYNLAVELAPEFTVQIPPAVAKIAAESLSMIKTMNTPELLLNSDLMATPGGYNWKASEFGIPY